MSSDNIQPKDAHHSGSAAEDGSGRFHHTANREKIRAPPSERHREIAMKKRIKFLFTAVLALCLGLQLGLAAGAVSPSPNALYAPGERLFYPGGMPFGVKFFSEGLVVVGFTDVPCGGANKTPAYDAGLRVNDRITKVNGTEMKTSEDFLSLIEGKPMEITFERDGKEHSVVLTPALSDEDGKYKTGMWVRDTTAGIGTVTFLIPETGAFAGLGHGICDAATGELTKMTRGTVVDVSISGITKGTSGAPGELKGFFQKDKAGVLLGNTRCGVFGVISRLPFDKIPEPALPAADPSEVTEGPAFIWSTLNDNQVRRFEIEIVHIDQESTDNRNFEILVKDEELIRRTGGIVQGMSGSPIIQNGRLVGAVTHVMIHDPTRGYGIFIENMLEEMPALMR